VDLREEACSSHMEDRELEKESRGAGREELRTALLASKLMERETAAAALDAGWRVERLGDPFGVSSTFASTYAVRAAHVRTLEGKDWQRLAASTEELAENLRLRAGTFAEWVKIQGFEEHHFVVLRSVESGEALGCMRVRLSPAADGYGA